jgi:microtubule-associated protein-like 6
VGIRTFLFHRRGVNNLCFSRDGDLLISTGMDEEHTIVVHNLTTGAVVGTGKAGSITLLTVSVSSDSKFLTGGEGHIKFWDIPPSSTAGGMLSVKSGIYNNKGVSCKTVLSSAYLGVDGVTGMLDGTVLLWKERSSTKFVQAHVGAVTSLFGVPGEGAEQRVLSGGRDGMVHLWNYKLTKIWSMSMTETTPPSCNPAIQALAFLDSTILIGTLGSEIYTVDMDSNDVFCLVQGHHDERAEVWGLAAQPGSLKFATAGDDGTIRLWDAKTKRAVCLSKAEEGSKVRSIVYKPDGSVLVAGTLEGKIIVLSADLTEEIAVVTVCSAGVRALSFSPDGATLAVGTSDGRVFLLDSKHYSCRAECRGHTTIVRALDFSADSQTLQASAANFTVLFFSAATGKRIPSPSAVRDVKWASTSSSYGWAVQGLWPQEDGGSGENATNIHRCARSPDGSLLLSGDNQSRLRLTQFPAAANPTRFKEYRGHAEEITNCGWTFDGRYAVSVGGADKAVLQYEVKWPKVASKAP